MWAGRPQPPLTRFARDVRAFLRGKGTGGTGRVEEAYPVGVARARETEHITVDTIRKVGTVGAIGEEEGCWQALVRFQLCKTSAGGKGHVTIAMETSFRPLGDLSDDDEEREDINPPPPAYVGGIALTTHQCHKSFANMLLSMYFTANETLLEGAFSYKTDAELLPPCGKAERTALAARKKAFLDSLPGKLGLDVMGGEEGQGRSGLIQALLATPQAVLGDGLVDNNNESMFQVTSVTPESLVDFYGVRVEDTIVGINGYPLIRLSRAGFLGKVAKALTTCASGTPSGGVLPLFLVRKRSRLHFSRKRRSLKQSLSKPLAPLGGEWGARGSDPPPPGEESAAPADKGKGQGPTKTLQAAAAAAAAQGRAERKELRKRPLWWDKRAKGSTLCILRLRPAKAAERLNPERRVQEDQGSRGHVPGEPMLPGAFLSGALQIGAMEVPAGAQLVSVGNVCCRTVPFERVLQVATSAGKGEDIAFEVV
ncbi:unnamed protein product [Ectocarpus sp. CCAP 1310/34]|nr:unnamed protein product [Ectocarpus sp. CCAP 1310/34]